jgi:hypothetical protein
LSSAPSAKGADFNPEQSANAYSPMEVTLDGIVMEAKYWHCSNVLGSMEVSLDPSAKMMEDNCDDENA